MNSRVLITILVTPALVERVALAATEHPLTRRLAAIAVWRAANLS